MKKSSSAPTVRPAAPPVFEQDPEKTGEYPAGLVESMLSSLPPEGESDPYEMPTIPPLPELPGEAGEIVSDYEVEKDPFPTPAAPGPSERMRQNVVVVVDDDGEY